MTYKQLAIAKLHKKWDTCTKCPLHKKRHNVVFGDGNPDAHILIVGEAPGADEDLSGRPFVGASGHILNRFMDALKLDRDVDTFITNVVCCRPTMKVKDEHTGKNRTENRPPSKEERFACASRLQKIIYIVDPLLIVTLGKVPLLALTGKSPIITKVRGEIQVCKIQGVQTEITYPVLPLLHPSYLARSFVHDESGPWWKTAKDFELMCNVVDYLKEKYYGIKLKTPRDHDEIT